LSNTALLSNAKDRIRNGGYTILFKRPNSNSIEWSFPEKNEIKKAGSFDHMNMDEGFLFFPFDLSSEHPAISIHSSFYEVELSSVLPVEDHVVSLNEDLQNSTSEKEHLEAVSKALDNIQGHTVDKVVIAKRKSLKGHVDPVATFIKATNSYPEAFVFLVNLQDTGTWIGATPERILQIKKGEATIDSLAGTQESNNGERSRDWIKKEVEEQRIVTAYIDQIFGDLSLNPRWSAVQDKFAGALIHLHSTAQFPLSWGERKAWDLLSQLHPTPAVCGTPKGKALDLIQDLENFDRQYYTGVLGPVSQEHNTDLYVNLRCMRVFNDHVEIFAGGGITKDSDPYAEWIETEHKCRTMLDLLS